MPYRVFSQTASPGIDPALLVRMATRHFEASLEILAAAPASVPDTGSSWVEVRLTSARRGFTQDFRLEARAARPEDWAAARRAEQNGRSAGMSALAERCHSIWSITAKAAPNEISLLNLCAILAAATLGPVLPADESALFGVRGAMERIDARDGRNLHR